MERKDSSKRDELSSTRKGSNRNPYANQPVKERGKRKTPNWSLTKFHPHSKRRGEKQEKGCHPLVAKGHGARSQENPNKVSKLRTKDTKPGRTIPALS